MKFTTIARFELTGNKPPVPPFRSFQVIPYPLVKKGIGNVAHSVGSGHEVGETECQEQVGAVDSLGDVPGYKDLASFADICAEFKRAFRGNNDLLGHATGLALDPHASKPEGPQ